MRRRTEKAEEGQDVGVYTCQQKVNSTSGSISTPNGKPDRAAEFLRRQRTWEESVRA